MPLTLRKSWRLLARVERWVVNSVTWLCKLRLMPRQKHLRLVTVVLVWRPRRLKSTSIRLPSRVLQTSLNVTRMMLMLLLVISVSVSTRPLWWANVWISLRVVIRKVLKRWSGLAMVRQSLKLQRWTRQSAALTSCFTLLKIARNSLKKQPSANSSQNIVVSWQSP